MVHLIFVCKYRKQLLIKYGNQINQILNDIAEEKHFWNERTLLGDGYFACSIGNVSKEIIEKYI